MSERRICKYCGMELSEDVPHGLRQCHLHAVTRITELEAKKDILENQLREATYSLIEKKIDVDYLYEDGFKLQKRIAELEAAQRWIPVSDRLPEEDTDGNALMAICRYSGEWVRTAFGAEFADEFVRHYTHWMYAPQPPEVQQ